MSCEEQPLTGKDGGCLPGSLLDSWAGVFLCLFVVGSEWKFSKYIGPTYKPLTPHMTSVTKPLQGFIFILAVSFQDVRLVSFL